MFSFVQLLFKLSILVVALAGIAKASPVEKRSISGDVTYFYPGLGACGTYNSNTDFIAAVSASYFDAFSGYAGGNPNANPLCGRTIQVNSQTFLDQRKHILMERKHFGRCSAHTFLVPAQIFQPSANIFRPSANISVAQIPRTLQGQNSDS
ncbi:hypothetical protein BDQ17DRAFT_1416711 [Cyathus striatus]|nr:hypothetical protein BDQ17DRAFT_1416711 [Cyathus striatus]